MKVLLIHPPLIFPYSIYSAVPILMGQLQANKIKTNAVDMNIEFLNDIISPKYLKNTVEILKKIYKSNYSDLPKSEYQISEENFLRQKQYIKKYLYDNINVTKSLINKAQEIFKHYIENKKLTDNEYKTLTLAFSLAYLPYFPSTLNINYKTLHIDENNPQYNVNYKDIQDYCKTPERNIYYKYFENKIKEIHANKYDIIGITIPFEFNLLPSLTLSRLLKQHTKAKIIIGGVQVSLTIESFKKYPELFNEYFDVILTGEGEKTIVDYVKCVEHKQDIKKIHGIVYKENSQIIFNDTNMCNDINVIFPPSYDNFKFDKYYYQEFNIEFSKGCYWGKCIFCYTKEIKKYYIKNPIKAVDYIEYLIKKYKINRFYIIDDALNLNFAEKFADEIIRRNINISWLAFLRLEKTITKEFLIKLKKSGLCAVFYGLESGSERILKLMNKGIDLNYSKQIIKDTHDAGIDITLALIYCFPTETKEDLLQTINFIKEIKDYIYFISNCKFNLIKNSPILNHKDILKISNIKPKGEFSAYLLFDREGISDAEAEKLLRENNVPYYRNF